MLRMANLFKYFYPKSSLKRNILDILDEIKRLVRTVSEDDFWIHWYGAYYIDPKHFVVWICVKSDKDKIAMNSNAEFISSLRNTLAKYNYPEQARSSVYIIVESQETVDRDFSGNWRERYDS